MTDIIQELRGLIAACTKGDLSTAQRHIKAETVECPACHGDGEVQAADYCNFDGVALGVQFYGIGEQFGAHEKLWSAVSAHLPALLDRLEAAERDRRDLLHALGWKTGPFPDDGTRKVVMDDTAGLRPEMVKARRRAQEAEGSAMMWHMIAGDRVEDAQSGLLLRIWRQLREEQQARRLAETRLAKARTPLPDAPAIREVKP